MLRILVPLDGSVAAEESLNHALAVAKSFPAEITLLRVVAKNPDNAPSGMDCIDFALSKLQARAYLSNLRDKVCSGDIPVKYEVAAGNPATTIVQFMAEMNPDLLILTRYGHGNARDFATGGTAQKVLSSTDCSVVLVNPNVPLGPDRCYHRILVTIDDSPDSECTLAVASMIAGTHDASLLLVQAVEQPRLPRRFPASAESRQLLEDMQRIFEHEAKRRLHMLATRLPKNLQVDSRVLLAIEPALAIESVAEDEGADLVMLQNGETDSSEDRRFNSINQSLIQYSHGLLFIFRPDAGEGFASNFRSVYLGEPQREVG